MLLYFFLFSRFLFLNNLYSKVKAEILRSSHSLALWKEIFLYFLTIQVKNNKFPFQEVAFLAVIIQGFRKASHHSFKLPHPVFILHFKGQFIVIILLQKTDLQIDFVLIVIEQALDHIFELVAFE